MSNHPRGRLASWVLLALAGLAIAVALSVTASNLSTQPIGLSGEPLRAGDRLAPPSAVGHPRAPANRPKKKAAATTTASPPAPTQTATAPTPSTSVTGKGDDSDDHGGAHPTEGGDD